MGVINFGVLGARTGYTLLFCTSKVSFVSFYGGRSYLGTEVKTEFRSFFSQGESLPSCKHLAFGFIPWSIHIFGSIFIYHFFDAQHFFEICVDRQFSVCECITLPFDCFYQPLEAFSDSCDLLCQSIFVLLRLRQHSSGIWGGRMAYAIPAAVH